MGKQMQSILLMANRRPIYYYLDFGNKMKQWWFRSETLFKYLVFKFYGIKPIDLPSRFPNKINRLKILHKSNQPNNPIKPNLNQLKSTNQVKSLPKRFPIDHLIGSTSNAPLYIKKWRRTFRSDLTSFALISLAVQNSTSEEEIQWNKLSNLLKQFVNKEGNKDQLNEQFKDELFKLDNFLFDHYIGKGCNAAIYSARLKDPFASQSIFKDKEDEQFAIKMLFNYDTDSNAIAIMKAMNKETIPIEGSFGHELDILLGKSGRTTLPAHPNIVKMYGVFVDQIPDLPKAKELFKNALPPRLHEHGFGRNMTLFIVMKRYKLNLKEYLKCNRPSLEQSLSLLTQLFKGVEHLVQNNISHRDLKTDNILLDFDLDAQYPTLVITDFGLCSTSLIIPYLTDDVSIGGNRALCAPEIITAVPGIFSKLDFSKSDLWACGALAYEIYNNCNPFYPDATKNGTYLNSYSYEEHQLPKPFNMPIYIQRLVREILNRDPFKRPEVEICSTLCALLMFCDELSLKCIANSKLNEEQLMKKINLLLSNTLFFARKKLNRLQLKLKLMFLMDLKIDHVKQAIEYFQF